MCRQRHHDQGGDGNPMPNWDAASGPVKAQDRKALFPVSHSGDGVINGGPKGFALDFHGSKRENWS